MAAALKLPPARSAWRISFFVARRANNEICGAPARCAGALIIFQCALRVNAFAFSANGIRKTARSETTVSSESGLTANAAYNLVSQEVTQRAFMLSAESLPSE